MATTKIADATGKMVEVTLHLSDAQLDMIACFVRDNKAAYFEDHSLEWALDEMLNRGKAEIKRTVKTATKLAEAKASAAVLKKFNMSIGEAQALFAKLKAEQAEAAKKAAKA